ncbi:hypothetical protein SAMN05216505_10696 [Streptomyces prasinopilosus]|uniref:Uncharacterized protein n=1 Tax=Streptomyces prasinopilosus TaxID=67344 RepID=A0A1G6TAC1_9ACTN|nr:hypothetical protein SAMN05216505_10696 [Streptomyces prasinopilosus]
MRAFDRAAHPLPRLTSRRHIDFGRASSALCRHSTPRRSLSGLPGRGQSGSGRSAGGPSASRHV